MFDEKANIIAEAYQRGVARQDENFKGDLIGHSRHIRTFAILTAENPFAQRLPRSANLDRNRSLERWLRSGNYVFRKVVGEYGGKEHSYSVYNIPLEEAARCAAAFNQESFVFGERRVSAIGGSDDGVRGNRMRYSFWQYDPVEYDKVKRQYERDNAEIGDERDEIFRQYPTFDPHRYRLVDTQDDFETNAGNFFSRRNEFRFTIPFDFSGNGSGTAGGVGIGGSVGGRSAVNGYDGIVDLGGEASAEEEIDECARRIGEDKFDRLLDECLDENTTGSRKFRNRVQMYGYRGKRPLRVPEGLVNLDEASLSHILRKDKYDEGYVIVSGCRASWSEDEETNRRINNEKKRELARDAKDAGFGYIPVFGGYIEKMGTTDAKDVFESSIMVFPRDTKGNRVPFGELFEWAMKEGVKFKQECVLIKEPASEDGTDKAPYYLVTSDYVGDDGTQHKVGDRLDWFSPGSYKVNDVAQQFFTSLRKKSRRHEFDDNPRRFTLTEGRDCPFSVFTRADPSSMSDIHARCAAGSLFNASRFSDRFGNSRK